VATFWVLACAISWLLWAPLWLPAFGIEGLPAVGHQHELGALGPIVAAFLVTGREGGREAVVRLARRLVRVRGATGWLALAVLGPLALLAGAIQAAQFGGDPGIGFAGFGRTPEVPDGPLVLAFAVALLTFGYGEEVGWRGFALPRLQRGRAALSATARLTLLWAVWHVPLFLYRPGYSAMGPAAIAGWLVSLFLGAVVLTWLWNASRGSLPVVAMFHASIDVAFTSRIGSTAAVNATGALVTIWGILVLLFAGPKTLARGRSRVTD